MTRIDGEVAARVMLLKGAVTRATTERGEVWTSRFLFESSFFLVCQRGHVVVYFIQHHHALCLHNHAPQPTLISPALNRFEPWHSCEVAVPSNRSSLSSRSFHPCSDGVEVRERESVESFIHRRWTSEPEVSSKRSFLALHQPAAAVRLLYRW